MDFKKLFKWLVSDFIAILLLGLMISPFAASTGVLAESDGSLNDNVFPYQKTFTISAYYSPLPCQDRYTMGSYESDIRMNGRGVAGADGTGVYPGMVAAPKSYDFGTKMYIPGVGIVAVHDRGGAIVASNGADGKYDRLDIWMGYGDIGLTRALNWGKRNVDITVYGIDNDIAEEVILTDYYPSESIPQECTVYEEEVVENNEDVLVEESVGGDDSILESVELDIEIDDSVNTADSIEEVVVEEDVEEVDNNSLDGFSEEIIESVELSANVSTHLSLGDSGVAVSALQTELASLNFYKAEVSGVYDEMTQHAVFKFQQSVNIVASSVEFGAGVYGPKTSIALNGYVDSRNYTNVLIASTTSDYFQTVDGNFIATEEPANALLASF